MTSTSGALRRRWPSLTMALAIMMIASCADRHVSNPSQTAEATRTVIDEAGRRVQLPLRIERIVSLAPNLTEIVYAVGAGNRLIGDTTFCDYPPAAKHVAKVGDTLHPSLERIIALKPQVVLVSTASQLEAFTKQLDEQKIAVFVTNPTDLESVFGSIQKFGDLFDEHERAEQLVASLRGRATAAESAVKNQRPVRVFYQLSAEPLYTAGRDSFVTDLIRRAGGQSVTANVPGAWPKYSDESALAAQPEAIILATGDSVGEAGNSQLARPLQSSPAARSGRVYRIEGNLLSRPGPRLVDGLEQMARALHPEAFK